MARYEYDEWGNVTKMFNRFGERVREGTGWIGDLNTGNGTPGSRLGPVDDNDDYDYHPGNGRGNGPNKETSVQTTEENLVTEEAGTEGVEEETVTQDITTDLVKENPYRYSHYYYDRKTQFYYLQARYYNPRIGRFISMDPWRGEITNPLSLNRYVYSYNNPVNYVDPTGYMAWYQPLHLILGIGQSGLDLIVDTLLSGKHMYDFSKALMQGTISFKDILSSVANGFKEPFVYLVNNGKKVWLDKPSSPSNKEVREYGRQLGHSLQIIIGSAALAAVGVKIISKGSKEIGTALQKLAKETGNQKRKPNNYSSNDISNKYVKNDNQGNLYEPHTKSTKGVNHGPTNPGPLNASVAATFRGGSYTATVVSETTTLYRVFGGSAGKLGPYWTRTKPSGPLQSQLDSALAPEWGNTAQNVVSIRVPKGTTIYEGAAAPQSTRVGQILGGGNQVYIYRVDPKWIQ